MSNKKYSLKVKQYNPQLDFWTGYLTVVLILVYIILFGVKFTGGFVLSDFSASYIIIILPIWIIDGLKSIVESFSKRKYFKSKEDLTKVTVVIACKDGEEVIANTLKSLLIRFKPKQIIVASNGSTDGTCQISRGYHVRVFDYKQALGKVRAINEALKYVDTPYVLLLDDDTLVEKAVIPTGLLDDGYDGVAFRVLVKTSTWITRIQYYEYLKSTDLGKRFHNGKASVTNISGAIGLFNVKHLKRQIKKHSGEFSGEDLQRTLLMHLSQDSKGVVLTDSTVYTQPPTTLLDLYKQRSFGWFPGIYANLGKYLKILTRDQMALALRIDAFYNIFFVFLIDFIRLLSLPILIFYPWYFVIMYISYVLLEIVTYFKSKSTTPIWTVFIYPFYGIFGFITRICALTTFIYRRIAIKISDIEFIDDYRRVAKKQKFLSVFLASIILAIFLILNIKYYFIKPILNIG